MARPAVWLFTLALADQRDPCQRLAARLPSVQGKEALEVVQVVRRQPITLA